VRALYEEKGVSTVLVIGGSGDYFDVADRVIALDNYVPQEVTAEAKAIAESHHLPRAQEGGPGFGPITDRAPRPRSVDPSKGKRSVRIRVRGRDQIQFGREDIDLGAVSQLVDSSQTRAIAEALVYAKREYMDGKRPLAPILRQVMDDVAERGLDILTPYPSSDLAAFRVFELGAALNRLRTLQVNAADD
jgi:predicted ABC-class ATPase